MEKGKCSWFTRNYLRKRPRLSPLSFADEEMASTSNCIPSTSSTSNRQSQSQRILIEPSDEELLKWQERQISKCIVQNSANQMVEYYLTIIEAENANNSGTRIELDREAHAASYHAYRDQENFEDSAILWAIDQHGLQQGQPLFNENPTETMSSSSSSISLSSPPHLSSQGDLCDFHKSNEQLNQKEEEDTTLQSSATHFETTNSIEKTEKTVDTHLHEEKHNLFGESSSNVRHNQAFTGENANEQLQTVAEPIELTTEPQEHSGDQAIHDEHFNFMETAVAAAIQEKGLLSCSRQMSPKR